MLLDSEVLEEFKLSLSDSIKTALMTANKEEKEVELDIKMNFQVLEMDNGVTRKTPLINFKVTRKIKETKQDFSGMLQDIGVIFDEEGNPKLIDTNNQIRMEFEGDTNE